MGVRKEKKGAAFYKTMREAVFLAARAAKSAGLCTGGTGNCSMIDRAAGIIAMTPHDFDRVAKTWQEIVLMNLAGEVLDVDGFTGGFNLQVAWATGAAAGRSMY